MADEINRLHQPVVQIQSTLNSKDHHRLSPSERQKLLQEMEQAEARWRQADEEFAKLIRSVDSRRAKIARMLLEFGTTYLINEYAKLEEELSIFKVVTTTMLQSLELGNSIVNKIADAEAAEVKPTNATKQIRK